MKTACLASCIVTLAACGKPRPKAPPAVAREACPQVGEAAKTDLPKLRTMFLAHRLDLVLTGGIVYEIPCSGFKVEGASEGSETRGHGEASDVQAHSEGSQLAAADEASRLGQANENSRAAKADEASKLGNATENSDREAANSVVSCERRGGGTFRLVSRVAMENLSVFDGAAFFSVGPDGLVH
jgi:hypothetical protein